MNDLSRLVDVINSNNTNDDLRVSGHVDVSEKETKIYLIAVKVNNYPKLSTEKRLIPRVMHSPYS